MLYRKLRKVCRVSGTLSLRPHISCSYLQTTSSQKPSFIAIKLFFEKSRSFTFIMPQKRNSDANSHLNFPSRAWLTIHNHWRRRADCRFVISGQREVILKHAQKYESVRPNYLSIEDKIRKFLGLLVQQWRRHHGARMGTDGHVPSTLGNGWARGAQKGL